MKFSQNGTFKFDAQHAIPSFSRMDYFVPDSGDGNLRSYDLEWLGKTVSIQVQVKQHKDPVSMTSSTIINWIRNTLS